MLRMHNVVQGAPTRGRFAPSPTGELHMGSLVAAVGSYLSARSRGGEWLVRIEDVDAPRTVPGAADAILRSLERLGFEWNTVVFQSGRSELYRSALERLKRDGAVFPCSCTRREVADSSVLLPTGEWLYPGTCRSGIPSEAAKVAWRVRVDSRPIGFQDRFLGYREENLETSVGDFVVLRADGWFAYQLAVVVDDADQGITEVVRGADLLGSTARQIFLQHLLKIPTPEYAHLPVITNAQGEKLSKQTRAPALEPGGGVLWEALRLLGQMPRGELRGASVAEIWQWAHENWNESRIPR